MVLKYHISPYPSLVEDMVVKIYEAQAPTAEIFSLLLSAPHTAPATVTANGLDKVVHIVRLYTATTLSLLHEYNVEPTTDTATVFDPIRFKIGDGGANTPIAQTDTYSNDLLKGLQDNEYTVFRNNYGMLFPAIHYSNNQPDGSFTLLNGDQFNDAEEFTIQRKPSVLQTVVNDSVVGKWFGGFVDITGNISYVPEHLRKMLRFTGAFTYTFGAIVPVPIGYTFVFNNYKGNAAGTITFANAALQFGATTVNTFSIPAQSFAAFVFDGTIWSIVYTGMANAATDIKPGQNIAVGEYNVGDVPGGDPSYLIQHNLNIQGNYLVFVSLRSSNAATYYQNNKIGATWYYHPTDKANAFYVSLQELASETQSVVISYLIVKA